MKKTILVFAILLSTICFSFAQNTYKVLFVNGLITLEKLQKELQQGTTFNQDDKLKFQSSDASARVIGKGVGRFVVMPDNDDLAYAKAKFVPARENIGKRGLSIISIDNFKNIFQDKFIIFENVLLNVNKRTFPMNEMQYFYIEYKYQGDFIAKKLSYNLDTLIINKQELFKIDGKDINYAKINKLSLYYYETIDIEKSTAICSFTPVFIDQVQLISEVNIILDVYKDKIKKEKIDEIYLYINEYFGTVSRETIVNWLNDNKLISN